MPQFRQVSIVGLGLIGGSLGMALRKGRIARRVIGFSRHERTIRRAIARGAVNDGDTELCPDWLGESDLVVLAVPPEKVVSTAREIAKLTRHSFLMTDVTSVKGPIVRTLEKELPSRIKFVGSHPMAGSERSGIEAAGGRLFRAAPCIVTRTARTKPADLRKVSWLWKRVGSRVFLMDPKRHDQLVAQISHVAHLVAAALTLSPDPAALPLAGNGFLDTTRVAQSDPEMWAQICRMNQKEISSVLSRLIAQLRRLQNAVARGSGPALRASLSRARSRRGRL